MNIINSLLNKSRNSNFEDETLRKKYEEHFNVTLLSRFDTLLKVVEEGKSLVRFGDGECTLMFDKRDLYFQRYDSNLSIALKTIIENPLDNLLLSFNNSFLISKEIPVIIDYERSSKEYSYYMSLKTKEDIGVLKRFSEQNMYREWFFKINQTSHIKTWGDSTLFFFGYYFKEYSENNLSLILSKYKQLFLNKNILFVGPTNPSIKPSFRSLFDNKIINSHNSIDFIDIESVDSFDNINKIIEDIFEFKENKDVLFLQAGPTAKVIAYRLLNEYKLDIQIIDVGSLNSAINKIWTKDKFNF